MKNGKRVRSGEALPSRVTARLWGQAAYLFFFLPFFFLATLFLPVIYIVYGVLKVAKAE